MRTWWRLLRDGLWLSLLRRPRATPLDAGLATYLAIWIVGVAIAAAWQRPLSETPRLFNELGLQTVATAALLRLLASALICALARRRALFWTVAAWLEAAALPVSALVGLLNVAAASGEPRFYWWSLAIHLGWSLAIMLRLALLLAPRKPLRMLPAALLALGLVVAPWFVLQPQPLWTTDWQARYAAEYGEDGDYVEAGTLEDPEATMYALDAQIDDALTAVQPQRPDRSDLYVVAFGGDASEGVFGNEIEYIETLFAQRLDADGRILTMLNDADPAATRPLATATNLDRALIGVGQRMDVEHDILFLYLTSHGGADHTFLINQPPLALDQITPESLRASLDASGIRWRVLVISACYSGGYVDSLRDPQTLVITASRADRTSFGCGAASEITWFGKAFLADALNRTTDFVAAFELARTSIVTWEKDEGIEASEPQIDVGERIATQLERWSSTLVAGEPVPFAPRTELETADLKTAEIESANEKTAAQPAD
jgi:hypothetical protein